MLQTNNLLTTKKLLVFFITVCSTSLSLVSSADASTFTTTSPTSQGQLPTGISEVGGIVLDLVGVNGARITSQLAASSLFEGFASENPLTIGTQAGFDNSVTDALGGGLQEVAVRFTLDDGDTASGDFDFNENTLLLNGINFGDWSNVIAEETDASGNSASGGFSNGGFRDNLLDTGWFFSDDATTLSSFFSTLTSQQQVAYELDDTSSGDNFLDFTRGIDSSLINVGQGPTVEPPVGETTPEPASILGLFAMISFGILKQKKAAN